MNDQASFFRTGLVLTPTAKKVLSEGATEYTLMG